MRIIFLDIDGVLNNNHTLCLSHYVKPPMILEEKIHDHLSPWCIYMLNDIIKTTDAKIVISSTWRLGETVERLQAILDFYGLKGEVIGKTPRILDNGKRRGDEIQNYIDNCGFDIESFVIIDDDSDMKHLLKHLIKIKSDNGLSKKDVIKCIKVLESNKLYIFYNHIYQNFRRIRGYFIYKYFKKWRY